MLDTKMLKPGDEVAVKQHNYGSPLYRLARVARITPTGRVTLEDGTQFLTNGKQIGYNGWGSPHLAEATDEAREAAERQRLIGALESRLSDLSSLPTATLEALAAVFEGEGRDDG